MRHQTGRETHHQFRAARIERGGVLIEHEHLRVGERGHEQRDRLPLSARKQSDRIIEPVLQAESDLRQKFFPCAPICSAKERRESSNSSALGCECEIFRNGQFGRGARKGILKHAANELSAAILGPLRYLGGVDRDRAAIEFERTRDCALQRALA